MLACDKRTVLTPELREYDAFPRLRSQIVPARGVSGCIRESPLMITEKVI